MGKFYVTTPIYYVNSHPHLGHLYTTLVADAVARYQRQRGRDTYFLTGTDEHGQNIERAAAAAGLPVKQHVDNYVAEFQEMFARFHLDPAHGGYDQWIRTTDEAHRRGAAELWRRVREAGYIYKGEYQGWYCINCNSFYTEDETPAGAGRRRCSARSTTARSSASPRRVTSSSSRLSRSGCSRTTRRTPSSSGPRRGATRCSVSCAPG